MKLPPDIEQIFFDTLSGDRSKPEFEQWLYADTRLESILNNEDYLELLAYGYKEDYAKYGLFRLLEKHIDKAELEKKRILRLLNKALNKDEKLPEILMGFYDMYCKGYDFLNNLGIAFGLALEVPRVENTTADTWEELTKEEQAGLLQSFYPKLDMELEKAISWIVDGKVILTGARNSNDHFEYIDNRTEQEKVPTAYEVIYLGKTSQE